MQVQSLGIILNSVFPDHEHIFANSMVAAELIHAVVCHSVVPELDFPCHSINAARRKVHTF